MIILLIIIGAKADTVMSHYEKYGDDIENVR